MGATPNRLRGFILCGLFAPALAYGSAGAEGYEVSIFPVSNRVFNPLLADPRTPRSELRYYHSRGENLGDGGLGNSWGIVAWENPREPEAWTFQFNTEAMSYSRFILSGTINELQASDFIVNVVADARKGRYSSRVWLFHESSHLGDDYIRRTGDLGFRYSTHGIRGLGSWDAHEFARLYAGGTGLFQSIPQNQSGAVQWGFELRGPDLSGLPVPLPENQSWLYLAQDFESWGRNHWNVSAKTEVGLRVGVPRVVRAMRFHAGYFGGHSQFGQFFRRVENYFDIGITLEF